MDLIMTPKGDVCKLYYARGGVLRLIMMFMIYKMRTSGQGDIFVDGQVDRV